MTAWYYSDAQRNRLGPIDDADLEALHAQGSLQPDTLIWRDGMTDWQPWSTVMAEVLGASAAPAAVPMDTPASDYDPYAIAERPAASPYAPPSAHVLASPRVLHGGRIVYAGFLKRFGAYAVDGIVAGLLSYALLIPLMLVFGVGMAGMLKGDTAGAAGLGLLAAIYAIQFSVPGVYYGFMQASGWQATLGKRMADTKIVRTDGSPIGFWRGFLRSIAFVFSILLTCGVGALATAIMTATTEKRQGLHDLICDTIVVDRYAFTEHADHQNENLNTPTKVVLWLYLALIVGVLGLAVTVGVIGSMAQR